MSFDSHLGGLLLPGTIEFPTSSLPKQAGQRLTVTVHAGFFWPMSGRILYYRHLFT